MAYTATITREGVEAHGGDFDISVRMVVSDGVDDVFDEVITVRYKQGDPIDEAESDIMFQLKQLWDEYADAKQMFDTPAFINVVSDIQDAANVYINL